MLCNTQKSTDASTPGTFEVDNNRESNADFTARGRVHLIQQIHMLVALDHGSILQSAMHYCFTFSRMTDSSPGCCAFWGSLCTKKVGPHVISVVLLLEHTGTKRWANLCGVFEFTAAHGLMDQPRNEALSASSAMRVPVQTNQVVGPSLIDPLPKRHHGSPIEIWPELTHSRSVWYVRSER